MVTDITMPAALKLFSQGDDNGRGYAPYTDVPGSDTVEDAVAAAVADGWEVVLSPSTTSEITVLRDADGALMGIADKHGPWAVVLSDEVSL